MANYRPSVAQWLTKGFLPTRGLLTALEQPEFYSGSIADFGVLLSVLRACPSVVPPEILTTIGQLKTYLETLHYNEQVSGIFIYPKLEASFLQFPQYHERVKAIARSWSDWTTTTILSVEDELRTYLAERERGLHQWTQADLPLELALSREGEEYDVVGTGDYVRVLARAIARSDSFHRLMSGSLRSRITGKLLATPQFPLPQKTLVKALKRISRRIHELGDSRGEHHDLVMFLASGRLRIRPLSLLSESEIHLSRQGPPSPVGALYLQTHASPVHRAFAEIAELEDILNTRSAREADFQRFFERHPRFLLGTDYSRLVSHPILVRPDEPDLVPDFVLVPYTSAPPKILELKRPDVSLARHLPNREGFLQGIMEARDQLLEYRTYFSSKAVSDQFKKAYGVDIYLPRVAVVIGRSSSFASDWERRKVESRAQDLEVLTYDDILERARRTLKVLDLWEKSTE